MTIAAVHKLTRWASWEYGWLCDNPNYWVIKLVIQPIGLKIPVFVSKDSRLVRSLVYYLKTGLIMHSCYDCMGQFAMTGLIKPGPVHKLDCPQYIPGKISHAHVLAIPQYDATRHAEE